MNIAKPIFFIIITVLSLTCVSCASSRSRASLKEKSATISLDAHRRLSFLSADSLRLALSLSCDSMLLIFDDSSWRHEEYIPSSNDTLDDMYFFSRPPKAGTSKASASKAPPRPAALKVYGLNVNKNVDNQSVILSSSTDSIDTSMQSSNREEDKSTKASGSGFPNFIFFTLLTATAVFIFWHARR